MEEDRRDEEACWRGHETEAAQQREDSRKNGENAIRQHGFLAKPLENCSNAQGKKRRKGEDPAVHPDEQARRGEAGQAEVVAGQRTKGSSDGIHNTAQYGKEVESQI